MVHRTWISTVRYISVCLDQEKHTLVSVPSSLQPFFHNDRPDNFFTLVEFIRISVIRRMQETLADAPVAMLPRQVVGRLLLFHHPDRAKQDINKQKTLGPIVMKTAVMLFIMTSRY